ncbi:DedA family protein [Metabacillus idriensis]|uniref:DedA family protein n=1 Tax=Metabacillus idriensis TaxID=324768 RepID=UPI00174DC5A7|nr:VTT domain-containing protein [Metabacillus idriensis]
MLDFIINLLREFGIWGLMAGLAIEASSLPFPGSLITLAYGYLLDLSILQLIWIALLGSLVYTVFSFIPYWIGYKLEHKMKKKLTKKKKTFEKTQRWFKKCGLWSIAIARPLGIGNYISYVSGLSKVKVLPFAGLTFLGIFPLNLTMLWLGQIGNLKSISAFMSDMQTYIFIAIGIAIGIFLLYRFFYKKKDCQNQPKSSSQKA